ncbi:DUF4231 domain-containing protein [Inquilinus sp.]|jgi:hypothetical protein|uniref:DUF4231 domain-containing protein n=1 Tax=Inquilinus sp. TaxID=1932117 RepID=UPI0037835C6D
MDALINVANRAADWSACADRLKSGLVTGRWTVFGLLVAGIVMTLIAGRMIGGEAERPITVIGAVSYALSGFLAARLQSAQRTTAWTRARAAAEALKRQAFVFAAGAAPYDDPATAATLLNQERERIERDADDLLMHLRPAQSPGSAPRTMLSQAEYRRLRIQAQAKAYYRPRAEEYGRTADRLRMIEFALALGAAVIAAVGDSLQTAFRLGPETGSPAGVPTELALILTTVASAILVHIETSRYQFLTLTYRATARRLESEDGLTPPERVATPADWTAFVTRCEDIIACENMSWTAKWTETMYLPLPAASLESSPIPGSPPAPADSEAIAARTIE